MKSTEPSMKSTDCAAAAVAGNVTVRYNLNVSLNDRVPSL
jgi:hypothetical protein